MKSKHISVPGREALKWHLLIFVVVTSVHWLTILATFEHPDNRELPFEIFRGFIVERTSYTLIWGVLLLAHFGIQELRTFLLHRAYEHDPFIPASKPNNERLKYNRQPDEFPLLEEDTQQIHYL